MKKLIYPLVFSLFLSLPLLAQTGEPELHHQLKRADKELNAVFETLKNKLGPGDKAALLKSQKDWLQFRTSNTEFKSMKDSRGGVVANKMKISYEIEMTEERTKEIKSLMDNF